MENKRNPELRFKKKGGEEYEDWEEKRLGEVANIKTGESNREDSNLYGEYTFFDRSQSIRKSNIYLFDTEAVIVGGEGADFVPKYFIGKFDLHQRAYAIMPHECLNGLFIYYYITKNRDYLRNNAVGSTVKSLRLPMFDNFPIQLPSLEEQEKIAGCLSSLDRVIEKGEEETKNLKEYKKGLMQKLFPKG